MQPFLAMAKELQRAGHRTRLSTHQQFEGFVRGEGVESAARARKLLWQALLVVSVVF